MEYSLRDLRVRDTSSQDGAQLAKLHAAYGRPVGGLRAGEISVVVLDGDEIVAHVVAIKTGTDSAELAWSAPPEHQYDALQIARRLATRQLGVRRCRKLRVPGDKERLREDRGFPAANDAHGLLYWIPEAEIRHRVIGGVWARELRVTATDGTAPELLFVPGLNLGIDAGVPLAALCARDGVGCSILELFDGADPMPVAGDPLDWAADVIERWARDACEQARSSDAPYPRLVLHSMFGVLAVELGEKLRCRIVVDAAAFKQTCWVRALSHPISTIVCSAFALIPLPVLSSVAGWVFGWLNLGGLPDRDQRALFAAPFRGVRRALRTLWVGWSVSRALRRRGPAALDRLGDAASVTAFVAECDHVAAAWDPPKNVKVISRRGGHTGSVGSPYIWARAVLER